MGYQFWSIVTNQLSHDSPLMVAHHISALICTITSAVFIEGFRCFNPLLFGGSELSTLVLIIINHVKSDDTLAAQMPHTYTMLRALFAFLFIWIRLLMFPPVLIQFVRDGWMVLQGLSYGFQWFVLGMTLLSSTLLLFLQFYWGFLIIKGLGKMCLRKKEKI